MTHTQLFDIVHNLQTQFARLQNQHNNDIDNVTATNQQLQTNMQSLDIQHQNDIHNLTTTNQQLKTNILSLDRQILQHNTDIHNLTTTNSELRSIIQNVQHENGDINHTMSQVFNDLANVTSKCIV
jgi:predicted  nucleic acid-binding Zn-ribbon protein